MFHRTLIAASWVALISIQVACRHAREGEPFLDSPVVELPDGRDLNILVISTLHDTLFFEADNTPSAYWGMEQVLNDLVCGATSNRKCSKLGRPTPQSDRAIHYVSDTTMGQGVPERTFVSNKEFPGGPFHHRTQESTTANDFVVQRLIKLIDATDPKVQVVLIGNSEGPEPELFETAVADVSKRTPKRHIHVFIRSLKNTAAKIAPGSALKGKQRPFLTSADLAAQLLSLNMLGSSEYRKLLEETAMVATRIFTDTRAHTLVPRSKKCDQQLRILDQLEGVTNKKDQELWGHIKQGVTRLCQRAPLALEFATVENRLFARIEGAAGAFLSLRIIKGRCSLAECPEKKSELEVFQNDITVTRGGSQPVYAYSDQDADIRLPLSRDKLGTWTCQLYYRPKKAQNSLLLHLRKGLCSDLL